MHSVYGHYLASLIGPVQCGSFGSAIVGEVSDTSVRYSVADVTAEADGRIVHVTLEARRDADLPKIKARRRASETKCFAFALTMRRPCVDVVSARTVVTSPEAIGDTSSIGSVRNVMPAP